MMTNLILLVLKSSYPNVFNGLKMFYKGGEEGFWYHSNISHPLPAMLASLCKVLTYNYAQASYAYLDQKGLANL